MITASDERKGLVKTTWANLRKRVKDVDAEFASLVDEVSPDASFALYLAYYPFGAIDADTKSSLFPGLDGKYFRIDDPNTPKELFNDLGYSKNNTPLGMVLEKQIECYIDLKNEGITIPWIVYTPGKIFPLSRILHKKNGRKYAPNGLLSSSAGSRCAFMLPNIGCVTNHINLQRDFNVQCSAPKTLYEHWNVFNEIAHSKVINSDWQCCVMYFSEKWLEKINQDKSWSGIKQYLQELAWQRLEYEIHRIDYDMIFSMIQQNRNLKPNPYLTDTAKHLFATATGTAPGYAPALDDNALPLEILQHAFIESYGLKKYIPTIMYPVHFNFEQDKFPIYYSLQNPSTHVFSPKSRNASSTLFEMRELEHITKIFSLELSKIDGICSADTVINKIAANAEFNYFHNKDDSHGTIRHSSEMAKLDTRFNYCSNMKKNEANFASDATFVRGCISIAIKDC